MNAVKDKLIALVGEELAAANAIHPPFASMHEGYAVMLEEVEEVEKSLEIIKNDMECLWYWCKNNDNVKCRMITEGTEKAAIEVAAEAIEVAAMARKFQAIGKGMNALGKEDEA